MNLPRPTPLEIEDSLRKWDRLENYVLQERSLKKLFTETYPQNNAIEDVLIKVCALNDFYSTNIFSPFTIAKHIQSLNIDDRLGREDITLVNSISKVAMPGGKQRNFYSFASKYCSHHKPTVYPIYDYFAEKMLIYFKKLDRFSKFKSEDLKNYERYKEVILEFCKYYGLNNFNIKQIDQYLWIRGKEFFPKSY